MDLRCNGVELKVSEIGSSHVQVQITQKVKSETDGDSRFLPGYSQPEGKETGQSGVKCLMDRNKRSSRINLISTMDL